MKILFVAVFNPESTNVSQADAFRENGCEVIEFNYREVASLKGDYTRDAMLVKVCKEEKPDLVLFSKCNEIHPQVVSECNRYSRTAVWYMDPLNLNYSVSLVEKIKRANFTFCALREPYEEAKTVSPGRVFFLHEGYDHLSNFPIDTDKEYDYCFIGNVRDNRAHYHKSFPFPVIQDAYGKRHSLIVSKTKINLNFTDGGTSDRTYKVLASKGFLLTEPWPEMERDFTVGKDLDTFTNVDELRTKIKYYLENEDERAIIASNGHETNKKFSRINWAKNMLDIIQDEE